MLLSSSTSTEPSDRSSRRFRCSVALLACLSIPTVATAARYNCPVGFRSSDNTTWDYTLPKNWRPSNDAPQGHIKLVENVHFTPKVEMLVRGGTGADPKNDILYTLRRFPNHPRALWALSRYTRDPHWKRNAPDGLAECHFQRALKFTPGYSVNYMIYGMHKHAEGQLGQALPLYRKAAERGLDSAEFHYNFALLLFDLKEYDEAKLHAEAAYSKGSELPGLKRKLRSVGHWP